MWKYCLLAVWLVSSARAQEDAKAPVVVGSINQFAGDWYRATVPADGNICVSPFAVHGVLSFLQSGAAGKTQQEMGRVLRIQGEKWEVVVQHENLITDLVQRLDRPLPETAKEKESPIYLSLMNRVDLRAGLPYRPEFIKFGQDVAGYRLVQHAFEKEGEKVRAEMNAWLARESRQRVQDLLPEGSIDAKCSVSALNGLSFRAPWRHPFDPQATKNGSFTLSGGKVKQVPMMRRVAKFGCLVESSYTLLSMPYGQYGELQMVIMVPRHADGVPGLERAIDAGKLEQMKQLPLRSVELVMPRFTVEGRRITLRDGLKKLGMKLAFNEPMGGVDFSEIEPSRKLQLQEMYQMTYLSVNEQGTEAPSAVEALDQRLANQQLSRPLEVRVDRPFLFIIQDTRTGVCLLMGRVIDPAP